MLYKLLENDLFKTILKFSEVIYSGLAPKYHCKDEIFTYRKVRPLFSMLHMRLRHHHILKAR